MGQQEHTDACPDTNIAFSMLTHSYWQFISRQKPGFCTSYSGFVIWQLQNK